MNTNTKYGPVSLIVRALALSAFVTLIVTKSVTILNAEVWDFHVHTEADDYQADRDRETIEWDRYDSMCERESRGDTLSEKEQRERDSYELRNTL